MATCGFHGFRASTQDRPQSLARSIPSRMRSMGTPARAATSAMGSPWATMRSHAFSSAGEA